MLFYKKKNKTPEWLTTGQKSRVGTKSRIQLLSQKDEKQRGSEDIKAKGLEEWNAAKGAFRTDPESDDKSLLAPPPSLTYQKL